MKIRISLLTIVLIFITTYDVTEATCAANEFECTEGTCIQSVYQCDDSFECSDRSDEENCTAVQPCVEGLQQCSSGECVANINDCPLTSEIQTTIASSQRQPSDNSFSGLKVGIIIGCVLIVVLLISIVVLIYVYKRYCNRTRTAQVAPINHALKTNHPV
ncbi:atrial natriuretic peptide-converting enzyme-like [Mytilus edulis]|uniref:atrial natriuretic peptide-converting enzyme-like n=1 Tax=Mytilus edulis TaxID=6550 RepID=UPI0039EF278B